MCVLFLFFFKNFWDREVKTIKENVKSKVENQNRKKRIKELSVSEFLKAKQNKFDTIFQNEIPLCVHRNALYYDILEQRKELWESFFLPQLERDWDSCVTPYMLNNYWNK